MIIMEGFIKIYIFSIRATRKCIYNLLFLSSLQAVIRCLFTITHVGSAPANYGLPTFVSHVYITQMTTTFVLTLLFWWLCLCMCEFYHFLWFPLATAINNVRVYNNNDNVTSPLIRFLNLLLLTNFPPLFHLLFKTVHS